MPLDEAYLVWLYSQVGSVKNKNRAKTYWRLLTLLYEQKFTWSPETMEKDGNRAQDGKDLRQQFLRETGTPLTDPGWLDLDCSFLEMLIALAFAVAFEGGGTQEERFWEMIENLGLIDCTDANPADEAVVAVIVDKVNRREYGKNGAGGLFPLAHAKTDQRGVELWYQANAYLLEELEKV